MRVSRKIKKVLNGWTILSIIIILLLLIPIGYVFGNIFSSSSDNWDHIVKYLLKDYILNSVIIVLVASILSVFLGVSLSWIVTAYEFPLRKFFKFALILPLAIPPYIGAYTYNGLLGYTGIIQTFIRDKFGMTFDQRYFDIMTIEGAILIFMLFLFPYVFIITGSFFEKQSATIVESARMLGKNSVEVFLKVVLPISRVSIIGGGSLVALEVLNDYGVVKYFGIPTFSTAIFKSWFGMGDSASALRLSGLLMIFVFIILFIEKIIRGRKKYHYSSTKIRPLSKVKLKGIKATAAFIFCGSVFLLSFMVPIAQLLSWSFMAINEMPKGQMYEMVFNSFLSSLVASLIIVVGAIIISNYNRVVSGVASKVSSKITSIGYSIPGAVIAMGVITMFIAIDRRLESLNSYNTAFSNLLLSGSVIMLIFAYFIRFLAIGYNSIESGFEKVGKKFFEASRTMGNGITGTFFKVDLPMIKPAVIGALILVFIDILKELPLTLILRPFNFNTLSTRAFEYANDEMIHEASVSSIIIIGVSVLAIIIFNKIKSRGSSRCSLR